MGVVVTSSVFLSTRRSFGETDCTVSALKQQLEEAGIPETAARIQDAVDEFCYLGLMLHENGRYLSLALPANPNW